MPDTLVPRLSKGVNIFIVLVPTYQVRYRVIVEGFPGGFVANKKQPFLRGVFVQNCPQPSVCCVTIGPLNSELQLVWSSSTCYDLMIGYGNGHKKVRYKAASWRY
jgi:hypothetical protein